VVLHSLSSCCIDNCICFGACRGWPGCAVNSCGHDNVLRLTLGCEFCVVWCACDEVGEAMLAIMDKLGSTEVLRLKPKSHMLCHVIYEDLARTPCCNPWVGATWRDEDFIGKMMELTTSVSSRTVCTKVMQYYCAKLSNLLP